jgi:hypothetical protein
MRARYSALKRKCVFLNMKNRRNHDQHTGSESVDPDAEDARLFHDIIETFDIPFWHNRIGDILVKAGFVIGYLFREDVHPIWQASLTRLTFNLSDDRKIAVKQMRKVLADGGVKIQRDQFNIADRRGDKIRCVFMLDLGVPGFLDLKHVPISNRLKKQRA